MISPECVAQTTSARAPQTVLAPVVTAETPPAASLETAEAAVRAAQAAVNDAYATATAAKRALGDSERAKNDAARAFRAATDDAERDRARGTLETTIRVHACSAAELDRAERRRREASAALTAATTTRDALAKHRDGAAKAGRLEELRDALSPAAVAKGAERALVRYARAYAELANAGAALATLNARNAAMQADARGLEAELRRQGLSKGPALEAPRKDLVYVLAGRVVREVLTVAGWNRQLPRLTGPIRRSELDGAETPAETAAVHALVDAALEAVEAVRAEADRRIADAMKDAA